MGSSEYSCLIHRPPPSLKECMVSLVGMGLQNCIWLARLHGTPLRDVGKTFDSGGTVCIQDILSGYGTDRNLGGTYPRCPHPFRGPVPLDLAHTNT